MNAISILRPALGFVVAAGLSAAASAASLTLDAISSTGGAAEPNHQILSLPNYDGSAKTLSSTQTTYGSTADGWVTAAPGSFSSVAHALAVNLAAHGYTGGGSLRGGGNQENHVTFQEQLYVGSTTLASGTPVDLSFSLGYNGSTSYLQSPDPVSGPSMWMQGIVVMYLNAQSTQSGQPSLDLSAISNNGLPAGASGNSSSGILHTSVGQTINFQQTLDLQAGATYFDSEQREMTADFSHTFRYFADAVTPGVTLNSETGHNYSVSAVPESSSAALMLTGLGAIGLLLRRRNARVDGRC
ncbi:MAG: PEP-CTERM sorting domain-containing protein [Burkholderiaceae bacterium]